MIQCGLKADNNLIQTLRGNVKLNVGSDATGDLYYRNSSGKLARLGAGTTGQILGVNSGLPAWQAPAAAGDYTFVKKTVAESLAAGATSLQNDDHLFFSVDANSTYEGVVGLRFQCSTTLRQQISTLLVVPSLETFPYGAIQQIINTNYVDLTNNYQATLGVWNSSNITKAGAILNTTAQYQYLAFVQIPFQFRTGGTGGTAQFQWSGSSGNDWTMLIDSFIKYKKL